MTAKMWLLVIQAVQVILPIVARAAYPFVRPQLKKLVDDPNTDQDEQFLDVIDTAIIGKPKPKKVR